jgi:hypothetical protein
VSGKLGSWREASVLGIKTKLFGGVQERFNGKASRKRDNSSGREVEELPREICSVEPRVGRGSWRRML